MELLFIIIILGILALFLAPVLGILGVLFAPKSVRDGMVRQAAEDAELRAANLHRARQINQAAQADQPRRQDETTH